MVESPQRELRSSEPPAPLKKKRDVFLTDVIHAVGVLGWVDELKSLMLGHGYGWEWLGARISPPHKPVVSMKWPEMLLQLCRNKQDEESAF